MKSVFEVLEKSNLTARAVRSLTQAWAICDNLHSNTLSCPVTRGSSDPIVLVEGRVVCKPNALRLVQLSRGAKTPMAAILVVRRNHGLPTFGCPTHVEDVVWRGKAFRISLQRCRNGRMLRNRCTSLFGSCANARLTWEREGLLCCARFVIDLAVSIARGRGKANARVEIGCQLLFLRCRIVSCDAIRCRRLKDLQSRSQSCV